MLRTPEKECTKAQKPILRSNFPSFFSPREQIWQKISVEVFGYSSNAFHIFTAVCPSWDNRAKIFKNFDVAFFRSVY
jgi:hypothetical protein